MEDEVKKVLTIEVNGDQTVKSLKQEISDLRDALLNTEKGTEDYQKILKKLIDDQKKLTSVMSAGKNEITAAAGSYNALQQEMTALKKVWREVTDEASRNEIGKRILEINNQLKEMDASIGVFNRNVGDYTNSIIDATSKIAGNLSQISPELSKLGSQISSLVPLTKNLQKTIDNVAASSKGLGKVAGKGGWIGLAIAGLILLIQNYENLAELLEKIIPAWKRTSDAAEDQIKVNNELIESNKKASEEMDFQARIMAAQGKSALEILNYKKQETEAILANTEAQIKETEAKIASIRAHSAFGRWIRGERKELKQLEESLESLVEEQKRLQGSITKIEQDTVIEGINATKKGSNEKVKIQKEELDKRLTNIKNFQEQAKKLTESYYKEEQKITKTFVDNTKTTMEGLYADVIGSIRKNNYPKELEESLNTIKLDKLPKKIKDKIDSAFKNLDLSKSAAELTNDLRAALDGIDLEGVAPNLQKQFKNLINTLKIDDVDINIVDKLKEALDTADFDKLAVQVETLFPDNAEIKAIVDNYKQLNQQVIDERKKAEKELYTERITKNAETLTAIREQEEKNVEDLLTLQLRERNALRGDKANDRVQQLIDEQQTEQKIYEERIKTYQNYITEYNKIANDENATDEARKQAKADVAQAEIELQNLVTEKTIANMEKQEEIQQQQIANTKEMINDINEFASTIGDILGSISDYWQDYVEGQVKAGKMSKQEGERQFKWIKAMQIAQTTIQTLAAAMAAFNGITSSTGGWGIAAAAAEMAAVIATGAIQIAKIKATQLESEASNNLSAGAQVRTITTDFQPNYVAAQTGASETDNLANAVQQSPIYVNVVEVENLMNKRGVRATESTF